MGLRNKKDAVSSFVLRAQMLIFLSISAWLVHHRYHKDPLEKKSARYEAEDISVFNLIRSQIIMSVNNMFRKPPNEPKKPE
ncbi:unnamed protein product [Blepharisma stoltei]|uniref:Uncharacterized protein n=1 Tax=Blepharisma stoltei TaxID=1481888 RepID=A0AAU9JH61_9CILI|nr:unnamed protein product [Blepharisma stoltei]